MSDLDSLKLHAPQVGQPPNNREIKTSTSHASTSSQSQTKLSPFVTRRAGPNRPAGALTDNDEFMAAAIGDAAWLKQTLKTGKNPSQFDQNGLAALHLAALHGRLDCLKLLVEKYNVDVDLSSSTGWRAVHLAINNRTGKRSLQCLQYLLDQGANPSVVNEDELTPAHQAAIEGSVTCLQSLINAGAKINIPDSKGHLAIDYAKLWGHRKCARILASESWRQDNSTQLVEIKKLIGLKALKHQDDLNREEVKEAEREFYGRVSFTNWLDGKGLNEKSTGPTSFSDCERHEPSHQHEETKEEPTNNTKSRADRMAIYQPNSVAKQRQPCPAPSERAQITEYAHTTHSGKCVRFENLSLSETKKSPKKGRRAQPCKNKTDDVVDLHKVLLDSAEMPDLPQEIIDRELFEKQSPHNRPLTFKCKNIIDAQHRRLYTEYDKPLTEMYAHLSDCADSSLFPSNAAIFHDSVENNSQASKISSAEQMDVSRMARTMKQLSKPKVFPSLTGGNDYIYGF